MPNCKYIFATEGSKIPQILNKPSKISPRLLKLILYTESNYSVNSATATANVLGVNQW